MGRICRLRTIIILVATFMVSCGLGIDYKSDGIKSSNAIALNWDDGHIKDVIGLSRRMLYMRDNSDTIAVTARYGGWLIDSIAVYEERNYLPHPKIVRFVYGLSKADKRKIVTRRCFEKRHLWLTTEVKGNELTFISPMTDMHDDRKAIIYLSKGDYTDSIKIIQSGFLLGKKNNVYSPIDIWPHVLEAPASGGKTEATTRGTTWWIEKIVFYRDIKGTGKDEFIFSDSDKEKRLRTQRCDTTVRYVTIKNEGKNIDISVSANKTGRRRCFMIVLRCNNRCSYFDGMQAAE